MSDLNSELLIIILQALVVGLLISVLLSFLLSKTMINPIEKLTEGAERVAAGDFAAKSSRWTPPTRSAFSPAPSTTWPMCCNPRWPVENERNKLDTLFLHMTDGVVAFAATARSSTATPPPSELQRGPSPSADL